MIFYFLNHHITQGSVLKIIPAKESFYFGNSLSPLSDSDFTSWEHGLLSENNFPSLLRYGQRKKYGLQKKQVQ